MEGVLVEGKRTTRIIPEGLQGNDRPITVVSEVWRSPELKIPLLIKTNDPRSGEMTTRLTNIELSNPILSQFRNPPPEYKIVSTKPSARQHSHLHAPLSPADYFLAV